MDGRDNHGLYEAILRRTAETHGMLAPTGELVFVSESVRDLLGWEPSGIAGQNGFNVVHPGDLPEVLEAVERLVAEPDRPQRVVARIANADGGHRWIEFLAVNYLDDPDIRGLLFTARNADELEQLRRDREVSERRLAEVAAAVDDVLAVLVYPVDGAAPTIEWMSDQTRIPERLGIDLAQAEADGFVLDLRARMLPESAAAAEELRRCIEAVEPVDVRIALRAEDGEVTWWWYRGTPHRRPDGSVELLCSISDITELQRLSHSLRERTIQLDALLDHVQAGVAYVGESGFVRLCNHEIRRLFGVEQCTGQSLDDLHTALVERAEDGAEVRALLDRVAGDASGEPVDARLKDGRIIEVSRQQIDDAGMHGELWILRDVTNQREVSQQVIDAQRAALTASRRQAEFLELLHRELRMPLKGIVETLEAAGDNVGDEHRLVLGSARSLLETLEHVGSEVTTPDGPDASQAPYLLAGAVASVARMLAPVIHRKGLALEVDTSAVAGRRYAQHEARIRQVVFQLMSNAVRACEQGRVVVSCLPEPGGGVRILIQDTGPGMSDEAHAFLLEPHGSNPKAPKGANRLTGLPLVRRLVHDMQGSLEVEVREPGERSGGTSIAVILPHLSEVSSGRPDTATGGMSNTAQQTDGAPSVEAAHPANGTRPAVLVVDDTQANAELAQLQLQRIGCDATTAATGAAALEQLRTGSYDLVLMDCNMPGLDGLATTRKVRAELDGSRRLVPIVAMTATAMRREREQALEAGMDDFLAKPVRLADLERIVSRWGQPLDAAGVLDADAIGTLLEELGDADTLATAIGVFLRELPTRLEAVDAAWQARDYASLKSAAHTVKGAAGAFAAVRLHTAAAAAEMAAAEQVPDHEMGVLVRELERVALVTARQLEDYVEVGLKTHSPSR